jgi:tRNA uridine 5-carboxymethylaminomethyl modification enzyme
MFTSRVEYRLVVREDNADRRLSRYGFELGILSEADYRHVQEKYDAIDREIQHLRTVKVPVHDEINSALEQRNSAAITQPTLLSDLLKRPELDYSAIAPYDGMLKNFPQSVIDQVEYEIKYEGFIKRQQRDIEKFRHIENIKIPKDINFDEIQGLSIEIRQKLKRFGPASLGQANRISGVTPAAISILMVYLRKRSLERKAAAQQ